MNTSTFSKIRNKKSKFCFCAAKHKSTKIAVIANLSPASVPLLPYSLSSIFSIVQSAMIFDFGGFTVGQLRLAECIDSRLATDTECTALRSNKRINEYFSNGRRSLAAGCVAAVGIECFNESALLLLVHMNISIS